MNLDFYTEREHPLSLTQTLTEIQLAQLIRREEHPGSDNSVEYWFKHALVQDTAYTSLMRQDRRRLHRLVAEALEQMYPGQVGELAPRLAAHFDEAGERERAYFYFRRAAQDATARYANREALDFYSRALDAAPESDLAAQTILYRERGGVYEQIGEFDHARSDFERSLQSARAGSDRTAEWLALMELGFVWLARDYPRAGEYFEKALELARESNDPALVGHTLNRVGNWYMNNEDAQRALSYHNEALSIFEELNDTRGLADTHDLLGMSNLMGSNFFGGISHFERSVELYQTLGDRRGTAAASSSIFLQGASLQSDMLVLPPEKTTPDEGITQLLPLIQELGWRSQEAFVLWELGERFASAGDYGRALRLEQQAIELAREIGHHQWLTAATMLHGAIHADLFDFPTARQQLESAHELAREIGSQHWTRVCTGFLASVLVMQNELAQAEQLLDTHIPASLPAITLGQRQGWMARAELALARHEPEAALGALDRLLQDAANMTSGTVIPRLWMLRAQVYLQMGRAPEAETVALQAYANLIEHPQPRLLWRVLSVVAKIYGAQGRSADMERVIKEAEAVVSSLAATLDDPTLRTTFVTRATEQIRQT